MVAKLSGFSLGLATRWSYSDLQKCRQLLFRYISDEIEGCYTQGCYYIVTEVGQRGWGRYTQIDRYTHSRKTQCRLYSNFDQCAASNNISPIAFLLHTTRIAYYYIHPAAS